MRVLGIIGGNLTGLESVGQLSRFSDYYLRAYAESFDRIYVFSKAPRVALPDFRGKCYIVEPRVRLPHVLYQLVLPFVHPEFRECCVLRVMHMTQVLPSLIGHLFWRIPYVATYGYEYLEVVWIGSHRKMMRFLKYLYIRFLISFGVTNAQRVIVTSQHVYRRLCPASEPGRFLFLPNGVDTNFFRPGNGKEDRRDVIRCLFVGRLEPEKDPTILIEALSSLQNIPVQLTVVGDGSLHSEVQHLADIRMVKVNMRGVRPYTEMPGIMREHDIFLISSLQEGLPKVLLEAMSCGLACIGTAVKGIEDLIEDGVTGMLCPRTPESIASAISRLFHDRSLRKRLGLQAREYVARNFDLHLLLAKETELLKAIGTAEQAVEVDKK